MLFRIQHIDHHNRRNPENIKTRIHGLAQRIIFKVCAISKIIDCSRFVMKNKWLVYGIIRIFRHIDGRRSDHALNTPIRFDRNG